MRSTAVVAVIASDLQNDLVAALHVQNCGHIARVLRRERGELGPQLTRAGIDTSHMPVIVDTADRLLVVNAADRSPEIGWLLLQRGASTVWVVSPGEEWHPVDDVLIDISPSADLPPRPVPPAHRSARTFRPSRHRRRQRRTPTDPPTSTGGSSRS